MKRVLVTGSTQGIGKAIASEFVKNGYEVIVHCSKDLEKAKRVCKEIGATYAITCDLSDINDVNSIFEKTGNIDILILNASVQFKEKWNDISEESMDKQYEVNVKSTLRLIQTYLPFMIENKMGRIVTIGSVNQYRQHPELIFYSATKCAVMSIIKNVAKQVASLNVTLNNVSPGAILTPRNESVYNDEEKRKEVESVIPMGRFGQPSDCVGAVMLLCSEQGSYITGSDIVIDGGMRL